MTETTEKSYIITLSDATVKVEMKKGMASGILEQFPCNQQEKEKLFLELNTKIKYLAAKNKKAATTAASRKSGNGEFKTVQVTGKDGKAIDIVIRNSAGGGCGVNVD